LSNIFAELRSLTFGRIINENNKKEVATEEQETESGQRNEKNL
jgi:hypothetical protein